MNLSIGAPSFEEKLLGDMGHLKNDGHNLSVGAASFDALLDCTEHFNDFQILYIYLHAKVVVHGLYNITGDLPELKVDKVAQHLNSVSALYYLFHIRSCATSTQGRYSGSGSGLQATSTEFHLMQMIIQIGIDCISLLQHCPSEFVELLKIFMRSCFRGFHAFKDYLTFKGAYTWFSFRSRRTLVSMPSNEYSGILALQAFQDYFQGLSTSSLRNRETLVYEGHKKLARALRQHRVELCNLCRQFYGGKSRRLFTGAPLCYPELEESDYAHISKLTLQEFNNKVLNPLTIHAFREIFLQHSYNQISHSSSNKTARESFIFHFAHFDGVLQELQIQLEHTDDIAAFSATCTQMRNEFTTFRSHRLDMKRAAESLQKKLNTYRYRSTNYLAETFEDFNDWDCDYETGYYYVYHRNYR